MGETAAEPVREVQYDGHLLNLARYHDDFLPDIPSFEVSCGKSRIVFREGLPFQDAAGVEGVEEDMFYIAYLSSYQKGMGTLLMKFALEEGARRGFERARMGVFNPKVISIVEKLRGCGIIKSAVYFRDLRGTRDLPSAELLETVPTISPEEASGYLSSFEADDLGYQDEGSTECIIKISGVAS